MDNQKAQKEQLKKDGYLFLKIAGACLLLFLANKALRFIVPGIVSDVLSAIEGIIFTAALLWFVWRYAKNPQGIRAIRVLAFFILSVFAFTFLIAGYALLKNG
ncbi:MAG: hypothetical protein R3E13_10145 [Alphaproteobacteria bacterium]